MAWSLVYLLALFGGIAAVGLLIAWIDGLLADREAPAPRRHRGPPGPAGPRTRLVTCRPGAADSGRRPDHAA